MIVNVLSIYADWVVVEFEQDGLVQRRILPRPVVDTNRKGMTRILDELVYEGLEYSDVDLPAALGNQLPALDVTRMQDTLRRRGLWRKQDYKAKSSEVAGVLAQMRGLDLATVTNAAIRVLPNAREND